MARTATKVTADFFDDIQLDAGILVKASGTGAWDKTAPRTISDSMIICATTGGINISCVPTTSDLFEDVDNAPNTVKEGLHIDSWACTFSTTAVQTDAATIRLALGFADIASDTITPRLEWKDADFKSIAWIGDMADGSLAVAMLKNAVSTGGLSLQTSKNGKGNLSITLTGFTTLATQTQVPMEFYVIAPAQAAQAST